MVVAKVRERFAVNKQAAETFDGERFNLRKLSELEDRREHQIKMSKRFKVFENLSDSRGHKYGFGKYLIVYQNLKV